MAGYVLLDDEPPKQRGYVLLDDEMAPAPKNSMLGALAPEIDYKNILAGAVRGAGSIGSTILAPTDWLGDKILGKPGEKSTNELRRQSIDEGLQLMGANPESTSYQGGKLGSEIAGTAGVGSVLGGLLAKIPALAKYAPVVESGGFNLGNAATGSTLANGAIRAGGGVVQGAAAAGMGDPEMAKTGAVIGGVLPSAVKVAGKVGSLANSAAKGTIGALTGVGGEAVDTAIKAGKNGSSEFLENLRGNVPFTDVLDKAKSALKEMRLARGEEYRNGMAQVSGDKTILDMTPIQDAINKIQSLGSFKGQVINKNASGTVQELSDQVDHWSKLNPAQFHTPEGLDALKKAIGDIRDAAQFGSPARKAADTAYNSVKDQITTQAPVYAKTMKGYSEASDLISEIERALSLGNKASADTSMRKLQSLMRNNVNTNYGNRLTLAKSLQEKGGEDILPAVAGQAMNAWTPRGITGAIEKGGGLLGLMMNPAAALPMAAIAPLTSPRLMGEALYKYGRTVSPVSRGMNQLTGAQLTPSAQGGGAALGNRIIQQLLAKPQQTSYSQ